MISFILSMWILGLLICVGWLLMRLSEDARQIRELKRRVGNHATMLELLRGQVVEQSDRIASLEAPPVPSQETL